mgnify:CR=1 FL=1|jgi:hypothetical protein
MAPLDQFYTKEEVAKECYTELLDFTDKIKSQKIFIEPSAGTGSFFKLLPENTRIGIDLEPKFPGIEKMDFFDYEYCRSRNNEIVIIIGNPPFGRVSSLAINFFNHSTKFADIIAFIIPRTFKRTSIQNKLNLNFHLHSSRDLPENGCFTPNMNAKCCFQIWERKEVPRSKIILPTVCDDFVFIKYGAKDSKNQPTVPELSQFDFAIKAFGSKCGEIFIENLISLRPKSFHFIKSKIPVSILINRLKQIDYSISTDTVRQNSLGKADLVKLYLEIKSS